MKTELKAILFSFFVVTIFIGGCKKDDDDNECPACPSVQSISPSSGRYGDIITINGINFNGSFADNIVKFNGMQVNPSDILEGSTTYLKVKVPSGCGTGAVTVDIDGELTHTGNPPVFTYIVTYSVSLLAGVPGVSGNADADLLSATFNFPTDLCLDNLGNLIVRCSGPRIAYIDIANNMVSTISSDINIGSFWDMDVNSSNEIYAAVETDAIYSNESNPSVFSQTYTLDSLRYCFDVEIDNSDNVYVSSQNNSASPPTYAVTKISPSGAITPFMVGTEHIRDFAIRGNYLYHFSYTDYYKTSLATGIQQHISTNSNYISFIDTRMAVDAFENIYITKCATNSIKKVSPDGTITHFAGSVNGQGGSIYTSDLLLSRFNCPFGIVIDGNNNMYITDGGNHCIVKITAE